MKEHLDSVESSILQPEPDKITRILAEWIANPLYSDNKKPNILSFEQGKYNFSTLVHEYGGGIAPITVLREFQRSYMVEGDESALSLVKYEYIPNYHHSAEQSPDFVDPIAITQGSSMVVDHINTIFHNLYREDQQQSPQLDMRATHHAVKASQVEDFYHLVDQLGIEFLDKVDDWLEKNAETENSTNSQAVRLGVGVYSIQGENKTISKG